MGKVIWTRAVRAWSLMTWAGVATCATVAMILTSHTTGNLVDPGGTDGRRHR
jgi:hypothetical protein